jgi:hypothetical protein
VDAAPGVLLQPDRPPVLEWQDVVLLDVPQPVCPKILLVAEPPVLALQVEVLLILALGSVHPQKLVLALQV